MARYVRRDGLLRALDFNEAKRLEPGDVILYQRPGEPEKRGVISGPIHVYPGPAEVVYVPIDDAQINRTHIIAVVPGG